MIMPRIVLCTIALLFFNSCSFNSTFHIPHKIETIEDMFYYPSGEDTTFIDFRSKSEIALVNQNNQDLSKNYLIENTTFLSSSGNQLNAWFVKPKAQKPIATILHLHGSGGNLISHFHLITPLIDHGFKVFMFDYSGYGISKGEPTHDIVQKDGYSALDFLKKLDKSEVDKIVIYGHSYGGYLAAIIGANSQDAIDGLVIEGAFTSLKEEAIHKASIFGYFVKSGVKADKEIQKNYKPLLIIHSKEDNVVPIELGRKLYENANQPKEFLEIEGSHIQGLVFKDEEIAARIQRMIFN